jgi:hypothetical protein
LVGGVVGVGRDGERTEAIADRIVGVGFRGAASLRGAEELVEIIVAVAGGDARLPIDLGGAVTGRIERIAGAVNDTAGELVEDREQARERVVSVTGGDIVGAGELGAAEATARSGGARCARAFLCCGRRLATGAKSKSKARSGEARERKALAR